jgi:ribonuclease HII
MPALQTALQTPFRHDGFAPLTAGVDEAGRGPLAGPVVAAAVILPDGFEGMPDLAGLDDSKKLTARRRETLAAAIRARCLVGVGAAEPAEIDRLNILHATMAAMVRALAALPRRPVLALIDGNRIPEGLTCEARAIIGGDASEPAIAAASIIAKTVRDALMVDAELRFPG